MRYVEDIANLGMPDAEEAGGKGANMGRWSRPSCLSRPASWCCATAT